jgi:hypothetical protein
MNIENLLQKKDELNAELNSINRQIFNYKDGFDYVVCVHSYGSHYKSKFNNLHAALELTNEYYQDNGFAHLFTNNPNVKIRLQSGDVYFIQDTSIINAYDHPEGAVDVNAEEDLQNECELNSLENQSNEQ